MTETAKVVWNELYYWRLDPLTWMKRTEKASQYFSVTMGTKFPEFRWCQGEWKLNEFAKFRYPDWKRYYRQSGALSRDKPSKGKRKANEDAPSTASQPRRKRPNNATVPSCSVIDLCSDGDVAPAPSSHVNVFASSPIVSSPCPVTAPTTTPLRSSDVLLPGHATSTSSIATTTLSPSSPTTSPSQLPVTGTSTLPEPGDMPTTARSDDGHEETLVESPRNLSHTGTTQVLDIPPPPTSPNREAVQLSSPPRRVRVNPLAGLAIPRPSSEVSQPESSIQSVSTAAPPKTKKVQASGKQMTASKTLLTAQNLYAIDYLREHPEEPITFAQFRAVYKKLDPAIIKRYEELSKVRKTAAATAAKVIVPSDASS